MQSDSLAIRRIGRSDAADAVMEQLAALIRDGELKEGDRLPAEKALAEGFGVSRTVVREALRGLRSVGLIAARPGSGSYVTKANTLHRPLLLGRYPVTELHEVRTVLEVRSAGLAAQRGTDEEVHQLQALVGQMEGARDRKSFAELDAAFHTALAELTHNSVHLRLVTDLHELIVENSDAALAADRRRRTQAITEHTRIAEAVARRDADAAEQAMLRHLTRVAHLLSPGHPERREPPEVAAD